MKILITGSEGFIGSALYSRLNNLKYDLYSLDIKTSTRRNHFVCDIRDFDLLDSIIRDIQPNLIIHLAARIDISEDSVLEYYENIEGVMNIIKSSNQYDSVEGILWFSTQLVNKLGSYFNGYDSYSPNTSYGMSKAIGERLVKNLSSKPSVIVRPSTVWGPGMTDHYVRLFRLIEKGYYFNPTFRKVEKSFSYIDNLVFQVEKILDIGIKNLNGRTFYLSDYEPLELQSWTKSIGDLYGKKVPSIGYFLIYPLVSILEFMLFLGLISSIPISRYSLKNVVTSYINNNDLKELTGDLPINLTKAVEETIEYLKTKSE